MSYRKHICIHPDWNHLCAGDHTRDHNARFCIESVDSDPSSVPLFELDGENAFSVF